jgi:hypothetical protein
MKITVDVEAVAIWRHEGETDREFAQRKKAMLTAYVKHALLSDNRLRVNAVGNKTK